MEFSGVYINYHHLGLLCDRMTCAKDMIAIFRSGLLKDDVDTLAKASFEVHTEVFLNASRHADLDHMRGCSANIMMGQHGYFGTNSFGLVLDMSAMMTLKNADVNVDNKQNEIEKLFGTVEDKNDSCGQGKIAIRNNISTIKPTEQEFCDDDFKMDF
jgi:DNA-directed RNA polymerase II subunit RPB1